MKQTLPALFSLLFAFICLQQAYSLPFLSTSPIETPTINAIVGNSGEINIKKDSQGFYIEADLAYYPISPPTPIPDPRPLDTVKMLLSLSNSETMAASSCLNFTDYNTTRYNWRYNMWETSISYPNFLAYHGIAGYTWIYLDYKYWTLSNVLFIGSRNSCYSGDNTSLIGADRYGVLGLGTEARKGRDNFRVSKNFSVYINPDLSSGKLIFSNDTNNFTVSAEPAHKLPANVNWRINIPRGHVLVKNYSADFNYYDAVFDVNSDAIGLPYYLYKWVMSNFNLIPEISCSSDLYKPDCETKKTVQDLPDIFLAFNDTKIRIPAKIYAIQTSDKSHFKLNFKAISPDLSGPNYVTLSFKDSIIFDARFMSYYFTVFDATSDSNVISLYPTVSENNYLGMVMAATALILLVIVAFSVKRKIAANKLAQNIAKEESLGHNYTSYNQRIHTN